MTDKYILSKKMSHIGEGYYFQISRNDGSFIKTLNEYGEMVDFFNYGPGCMQINGDEVYLEMQNVCTLMNKAYEDGYQDGKNDR